jgi:hypothetical protein
MKKFFTLLIFAALSVSVFAQSRTITGKVTDDSGIGLPGVNIQIKGTATGATSNLDGSYQISVSDGVLVFRCVGFVTQEIPLSNQSILNVVLKEDLKHLNEVVVIGYGSQKKSTLTGAISSTKSSIQGKAAGVAVSEYSFGKTEFKTYFEMNRKPNLCNNEPTKLKAKFRIDEFGRPTDLTITDCDCPELQLEFARIINQSPNWSEKNKNVELILKIN